MANKKPQKQQKNKKQEHLKEIDRKSELDAKAAIEVKASEGKAKDKSELIKQLMDAAKSGDVEKVERLIEEEKVNVNSFDDRGQTALHYASECGKIDVVKELLNLNADINILEKMTNVSPLTLAIGYNEYSVVEQLLLHDINCYLMSHSKEHTTPLAKAALGMRFYENWEMVKLLLQTHETLRVYSEKEVVEKIEDAFSYAVDREYAEYSYLDKYKNLVDELGISDLQQYEL